MTYILVGERWRLAAFDGEDPPSRPFHHNHSGTDRSQHDLAVPFPDVDPGTSRQAHAVTDLLRHHQPTRAIDGCSHAIRLPPGW